MCTQVFSQNMQFNPFRKKKLGSQPHLIGLKYFKITLVKNNSAN